MDKKAFIDNIVEQLEDYSGDELTMETLFRELDEWDSLTGVAVQLMIQEKYGSKIPDQPFRDAKTLNDLYNLTLQFKS